MKIKSPQIKTLLKTIRPPFLVLTPVCVFLGLSTSLATESPVNYFNFFLIMCGAISAHISVNTLNEYCDFRSGLDFKTEKTAFSGGSGALPDNPEMAQAVLTVGLVSLMVTIIIGIIFIFERGALILPVGIAGVLLVVTYTQWLNQFPLLCLIAPGLGFGVLMVVGSHVILTGAYSELPWFVPLVPFFLVNNLLLLNQYPDIKADASIGRNTFPISFGLNKSNIMYAFFLLAAYSLILVNILQEHISSLSFIAVIPALFSIFALVGASKYASKIGDYPRYMGANVAAAILTPLLLGVSILNG